MARLFIVALLQAGPAGSKRARTSKDWATKALRPSVQGNRSSELVFEVKTLFTTASRRASSESIYITADAFSSSLFLS